jgi:hypothetical protein
MSAGKRNGGGATNEGIQTSVSSYIAREAG